MIEQKDIDTRMMPEWIYVREMLDYNDQKGSIKALIDSFMLSINDGVSPNDMLNIMAQLTAVAVQMTCDSGDMTEQQVKCARANAIASIANSLPEIFDFHATNMPVGVSEIVNQLNITPQGMFVANDSELQN